MKVAGVIAEYNPFHKGHQFHLDRGREITHADYVIVVMSGNYVQRGTPAMFDKYTRAEAALRSGADLVLELPVSVATGSAEYFASGAVKMLADTGIVTDLCFGSECGSLMDLQKLADILAEEPEEYQILLRKYLKEGMSFPAARAHAMKEYAPDLASDLLDAPNNLLGLEYLKALKRLHSTILPHTIQREGNAYHDITVIDGRSASASGIRGALMKSQGVFTDRILQQLPFPELYKDYEGLSPISENSFSLPLLQKLRALQDQPLEQYFGVSAELSNRIWNRLDEFSSFSGFTDLLKTRELTRTSVSRALLHVLLDVREYKPASVFRVLGFRKSSAILLKELSAHGNLPVITSISQAGIPPKELYADHLYESVRSLLHGRPFQNEYRRKMLVI